MNERTNFQIMKELKDWYPVNMGFISEEEMNFLSEELELKRRSIIELRNLRDFVVCFFVNIGHKQEKEMDWDAYIKDQDKMSAICGVIDKELWRLGEEV